MSVKSYLSKFLLKRVSGSKADSGSRDFLFEKKLKTLLIILPEKDPLEILMTRLSHSARSLFTKTDFLILKNHAEVNIIKGATILSSDDLKYNGRFKKKDFSLNLDKDYDIVINFSGNEDPTLELFILSIPTSMRIRFDRDNEKFYNFIVPIENKDIHTRFEQFLKVYQTLKK